MVAVPHVVQRGLMILFKDRPSDVLSLLCTVNFIVNSISQFAPDLGCHPSSTIPSQKRNASQLHNHISGHNATRTKKRTRKIPLLTGYIFAPPFMIKSNLQESLKTHRPHIPVPNNHYHTQKAYLATRSRAVAAAGNVAGSAPGLACAQAVRGLDLLGCGDCCRAFAVV
jgi:hypothetical protein